MSSKLTVLDILVLLVRLRLDVCISNESHNLIITWQEDLRFLPYSQVRAQVEGETH